MSLWEEQLCHLLAMGPLCALGPSPGRGDRNGPAPLGNLAGFSDVVANKAPRAWRTSKTHLIGTSPRPTLFWGQPRWGAGTLTGVGVTAAMLIAGAGDAAGIGTPQGCLPLVSRGTGFTELAHVSLGTGASLHPGGGRGEAPLGRHEPDLTQEHLAWE